MSPNKPSDGRRTGTWHYYRYRWRWFRNKGLAIILFWSFAVFTVWSYFIYHYAKISEYKSWSILLTPLTTLFFPLSGWLADVYVGRYKVIRHCLRIILLGTFLLCMELALTSSPDLSLPKQLIFVLDSCAILLVCIGISGFQANIIQFSMDQLFDSSSFEISSFVLFYVWSFFASYLVVILAFSCLCPRYIAISYLLLALLLSLAVSSDFLFSHWLIKEPVSCNPLKLIFQVLRYAAKNKYPHLRSAFTYWDDKKYSRLDLAKKKYGGPFTTEHVEDVKTFFRMLAVIVTASLFMGLMINSMRIFYISQLSYFFAPIDCTGSMKHPKGCFKKVVLESGSIVVFLGIPLWEIVLFPFLWKSITMKLKILLRVLLAMIFFLLFLGSNLSIELFAQVSWHSNATLPCVISTISEQGFHHYNLSYWWLVLPSSFFFFGFFLISVAGFEFISAQSPYSMKGLLFGMVFLGSGFSMLLFYPLFIPFKKLDNLGHVNCMFWYWLACVVVALVIIVAFLIMTCCYKNRQRDDNLPSQQFLADVYSDHHNRHVSYGSNINNDSMSVSQD